MGDSENENNGKKRKREDEEEPEEDKAPVKKTKKKEREEDEEEAPAAKTVKPELEDEEEQTKDPSVTRRRYKKQEPQEAKEDDVPVKRNKKQPSAEEKEDKAPAKKPKKAAAAVSEDTKTKKADKPVINTTETDHQSIDYSCERKNANGDLPNFKISTWNVGGIRSWVKKDGLKYITAEDPDIFCLQEVKCSEDKLPEEVKVPGYKTYWCGSDKEGYAGVALYSKTEPIEVKYGIENEEFDDEGRCITAEYEQFYLINVYVPNAGRGLVTLPKRLSWNDVFKAYVKELDSKKPVIVCGDMNVAHNEIDIANPKSNKKSAGFTQEERDGMTDFLGEGYVDSYRELYPDQTDVYTYWTYMAKARSKNIGWRLDYFIVSKRFMDTVCDNVVRSQVFGSDHCPVVLFVHL